MSSLIYKSSSNYSRIQNLRMEACKLRLTIVKMLAKSGSGHPGGSLSCVDILAALFFSGVMCYDRKNPSDRSGDRFLLSKGHAAPALYAVYHRLGWVSDEEISTLRVLTSRLQGHSDAKFLPAVEVCSGSLGQGLSVGVGLALALAMGNKKVERPRRVFVLCGDGEMQEGSNWEALALASHLSLRNITLIIDRNGLQIDGKTEEICSLGELSQRLSSFGWEARDVDGHDLSALCWELNEAVMPDNRPLALVCHTTKGRGVTFMEDRCEWHGRPITPAEAEAALAELESERAQLLREIICNDK